MTGKRTARSTVAVVVAAAAAAGRSEQEQPGRQAGQRTCQVCHVADWRTSRRRRRREDRRRGGASRRGLTTPDRQTDFDERYTISSRG